MKKLVTVNFLHPLNIPRICVKRFCTMSNNTVTDLTCWRQMVIVLKTHLLLTLFHTKCNPLQIWNTQGVILYIRINSCISSSSGVHQCVSKYSMELWDSLLHSFVKVNTLWLYSRSGPETWYLRQKTNHSRIPVASGILRVLLVNRSDVRNFSTFPPSLQIEKSEVIIYGSLIYIKNQRDATWQYVY